MALPSPTVLVGSSNVGSTSNATTYTTGTFTVTPGSLLIYAVAISDADDPGTMNISSTGTWTSTPTWTERCNVSVPTTVTDRLKIWTGVGGVSAGASTITVSGMPDACTGCNNLLLSYASGWDSGGPIINVVTATDNTTATSQVLTFGAFGSTDNHALAFCTATTATSGPTVATEGGEWAAVGVAQTYSSPVRRMAAALSTSASDTSISWSWTTAGHSCAAGIEVVAAAAGTLGDPAPYVGGGYYPTEG